MIHFTRRWASDYKPSLPQNHLIGVRMSHWHLSQAANCFASAKRLVDPNAAAFLKELGWILLEAAEASPARGTTMTGSQDARSSGTRRHRHTE
jgi:hypothetical protein